MRCVKLSTGDSATSIDYDPTTGLSLIAWYRSEMSRDRATVCCLQYDHFNEQVIHWSEWAMLDDEGMVIGRYGFVPGSAITITEPQQVAMYLRHMHRVLDMDTDYANERKRA